MKYDVIVVGAGIVGLASAFKILEKNPRLKLLIIEKENQISKHQSGNNSGVIHSGIYYKPKSLKAINCINGYKLLVKFAEENDIKFEICGKIIVATSEQQIPDMLKLYNSGIENGLNGIKIMRTEELKEIEPYVNAVQGIFVPQTGIINYSQVSEKYLEKIKQWDGEIVFNSTVINIKEKTDECEIITEDNHFQSKYVLTCGGLYSDYLAKMTNPEIDIRIIPFRGEYYKIKEEKKHLIRNLIYPVPDPNFPFLGVHFTRMIDGKVEAGPNAVLAFKLEGYRKIDINLIEFFQTITWPGFISVVKKYWKTGIGEFYRSFSKKAFVKELQKMIPEIQESDLEQGGAGVRAQACSKKGGLIDDFYFVESKRLLHVCNAPSPAATSSLSIGDYVANRILNKFN
ncbi:L-2-hydroxyglutarate oxidase [Melioribacteraceae bacterium 4301-Me]|uniref:L-2-hydroxyglutarate oxidase n=1 Tax=Pyranulibacter aquaticus TaxID=3163344 RepID=UPI00359648A7